MGLAPLAFFLIPVPQLNVVNVREKNKMFIAVQPMLVFALHSHLSYPHIGGDSEEGVGHLQGNRKQLLRATRHTQKGCTALLRGGMPGHSG